MTRTQVEGEEVHLCSRDGERRLALTAPEFLLRLAAVSMPPGVPLTRYMGAGPEQPLASRRGRQADSGALGDGFTPPSDPWQ